MELIEGMEAMEEMASELMMVSGLYIWVNPDIYFIDASFNK